MGSSEFHIHFACQDSFSDEWITERIQEINTDGLILKAEKREPAVFASLEWAVPGIIVAYLAKPYFESFLNEAGKDHYVLVKKWLQKLLKTGFHIRTKKITATRSTEKLDDSNTQSLSISIYIQLKSGYVLKLLFDETLEEEDWCECLDTIMDLVNESYRNNSSDILSEELSKLNARSGATIYSVIDPETKSWIFYRDIP